jgi:hypothetical protein
MSGFVHRQICGSYSRSKWKKKNRKKSLSQNQVTYSLIELFTLNSDEKMLL